MKEEFTFIDGVIAGCKTCLWLRTPVQIAKKGEDMTNELEPPSVA
jgi:hypothetical protein